MFGLLGPNGAGKSTTVRILATLTKADAGLGDRGGARRRVRAGSGTPRNRLRPAGVGRRPRGDRAARTSSSRVDSSGMRGADLERRARDLLETFALSDKADALVKTYSGGMKRRLDVAMGLVHRPQRALPRRADDGPRPGGASGDVGGARRPRRRREPDDPAHDPLPRGGRPARRRVAIVSRGKVVVEGTPEALKRELRGDAVTVELGRRRRRRAGRDRPRAADGVHEVQA